MFPLIFGFVLAFAEAAQFPSGFDLCHRSDPGFNKCVAKNVGPGLKAFAKGSKHYSLPILDPFSIKEMGLKSQRSGTANLDMLFNNVKLYGLSQSDCTDYRMSLDGDNCGYVMELFTPTLRLEADYELKGNLLMFPINGKGKCNITLHNLDNTHTLFCEKVTIDGKTYMKGTNYTMNTRPEKLTFNFENIFPGNEQISTEVMRTMNENSLEIYKEIKSSLDNVFSTIHVTMWNILMSKVPYDEVFLD